MIVVNTKNVKYPMYKRKQRIFENMGSVLFFVELMNIMRFIEYENYAKGILKHC